ncbi:MAG: 50S ribosomal protein L11 methyltransferase [Clostridia bacterium]|nr:50S ribosomal protein L11 methyltransferase [Clostridia bacterium]
MDWTEIKIKVPTEATDEAAAIANMTVSHGIYIEDYSDLEQGAMEIAHIDLIDEELVKSDRTHSVIHIYLSKEVNPKESIEYITERLTALNIEHELGEIDISEEEWENNWKQFFKCTEIGKRLCVRPSWEEYENTENRVVLSIDPGAAFGTGTHATTSMCLEALEKLVTPDITVLDIGSGSGILSIAAILLGAKDVVGVDIDPVAVKVAKENAALNGVAEKANYVLGNLDEEITDTFDIVVANIVADAIIALSSSAKKRMKKGGYFLCSGIIDIRADEVEAALTDRGYEIVEKMTNNNWVAFLAK